MTANLKTPDPECDLDYVTEGPRDKTIGAAISNSFGFGGTNSCVAFRHRDFK
jgi:3-oxoacyl-(acyl-carrier-protein) synthase